MSIPILLSNRAMKTPASPIRRLAHLAHAAMAEGNKVYHLNIGQPDVRTPKAFFEGLSQYSEEVVAYDASEGNETLRKAWTSYMNTTLGLNMAKEQMLITTGASEALVFTFMTCCDPGDDVLIFDPTYANYIGFAAISGVRLVPVLTKFKENFALPSAEKIIAKITNRTRVLLLCSPNNPTGTVYTREELQMLLDICNERNIFLVVDETYRELVYDGKKPLSIFHLDSNNDRIIVIDSLSKRFSLCGARLGCMITTNGQVLVKAANQAQARLSCPTIEQFASAHMLENLDEGYVESIRTEYEGRRDVLCKAVSEIEGVEVFKPHGAFYTVARLPFRDTEGFASFMLGEFRYKEQTVFAAPASGFYMENHRGADKLRLAFVLEKQELLKAAEVLGKGIKEYQTRIKAD